MLLGLPTTVRFFAGQGGGFQNGSGPKTNFFLKKEETTPRNYFNQSHFEPQGSRKPRPWWRATRSDRMDLGPQGTLLSSAVDHPIQHDDPKMAVMLQHKSNLKTFVTK